MFLRSSMSIILAIVLIGVGGIQLIMGWSYTEVSKREASTVGKLVRVERGRSSTYVFRFQVNGVLIQDDSSTCKTALTPAGCKEGALVLVYYDPEQTTGGLLEEFGAAARERIFMGVWMVACGLLVAGLHFLLNRRSGSPDEPRETDEATRIDEPEFVHLVPGE